MRSRNKFYLCVIALTLTGCGTKPIQPSTQHIQQPATHSEIANSTPPPITGSVILPPAQASQ